jgi:hypothetical protein
VLKNRCVVLLIALAMGFPGAACRGEPEAPEAISFYSPLLFLHPVVNYAIHPDWLDRWERGLLARPEILGNFGSVATDDLMVAVEWALNHELAKGVWFRNDITWLQTRHSNRDVTNIYLGFEVRIWRGFAGVIQCQPAYDKEELDIRLGGMWANASRDRYVQLLYVREDLVYDEKNDKGGRTQKTPHGIAWLARLAGDRWSVFSRGRYSSGFAREFPDPAASPELFYHTQKSNDVTLRLRYAPGSRAGLEASYDCYTFDEEKQFRNTAFDFVFGNEIRHGGVRILLPLNKRWRLRGEGHYVRQEAGAAKRSDYIYLRREGMPALFVELHGQRYWIEAGYMGTFYKWEKSGENDESGYADKVKLGWVYSFKDGAHLQLSVSHEPSLSQFGGGSIQFLTQF